jgi:hypothetical protein
MRIYSPYAGRGIRPPVKSSGIVERGQALFIVAATDAVEGMQGYHRGYLPFGSQDPFNI